MARKHRAGRQPKRSIPIGYKIAPAGLGGALGGAVREAVEQVVDQVEAALSDEPLAFTPHRPVRRNLTAQGRIPVADPPGALRMPLGLNHPAFRAAARRLGMTPAELMQEALEALAEGLLDRL